MDKTAYVKNMIRAADYIEKHIKTKIHINELAAYAYMSEDHFWRTFKKLFGESVGDYIRKRRLTVIAEKLLHDRRSVCGICVDFGFDAIEPIFRAFKKQFGVTPVKYRKMNRAVTRYLRRERMTAAYIRHVLGGGISGAPVYRNFPKMILRGNSTDMGRGGNVGQGFIFAFTGILSHLLMKKRKGGEKFLAISGSAGKPIFSDSSSFSMFRGTAGGTGPAVFKLKKGRYAVYHHRGPISNFIYSSEYIFMRSLPPETAKNAPYIVAVFTKDGPMARDFEIEFRVPVFK